MARVSLPLCKVCGIGTGLSFIEPTTTPDARSFKAAHIGVPVNAAFVDRREQLFLGLNQQFDAHIDGLISQKKDVVTTGSSLITKVTPALMRVIVGGNSTPSITHTVASWLEDSDTLKPDHLTLVYAPDEVITERIRNRQKQGDSLERSWGFNAPHFLSRCQDTWQEVLSIIGEQSDIPTLALDSSQMQPVQMIEAYEVGRNALR